MEKRCGIKFLGQDIYVNVAGGIRLNESAVDAALAVAIYSARNDIALPVGTAVFGELSLAGEIRPVPKLKQRIKTAEGLGFTKLYSPDKGENAVSVSSIKELLNKIFS